MIYQKLSEKQYNTHWVLMQVYKMTGISVWYIGNLSQLEVVILVHQRLFLFHFVGFTTKRHEIRFDIGWKSIC